MLLERGELAVAPLRGRWRDERECLGRKQVRAAKDVLVGGGDSEATHQDLDHGTFVWETRGCRWAIDLGTESYALPGIFLPFAGRYSYYRKATRGHNCLTFGDPGGFRSPDAAATDQRVNIFSSLTPGVACSTRPGASACSAGELATIDLRHAYSPRSVVRTFSVDAHMTQLTVDDRIGSNSDMNVTWSVHTRATVALEGAVATLHAAGMRVAISFKAVPQGACESAWQATPVKLPESEQLKPFNGKPTNAVPCAVIDSDGTSNETTSKVG